MVRKNEEIEYLKQQIKIEAELTNVESGENLPDSIPATEVTILKVLPTG